MTVQANQGFGVSVFTTGSGSGSGSTTPGGGTGTVQYNIAGSFAGAAGITTDGTSLTVSGSSSSDMVRITQTGTGNALLVEDSANPDASPFVVDTSGNVGIGEASPGTYGNLVVKNSGSSGPSSFLWNTANDATSSSLQMRKDRAGTIVVNGDSIGLVAWYGYDGASYLPTGAIRSSVDGVPGLNDMPGRLVFSTTADGAASATERMRIDNAGNVGIGATPSAGRAVSIGRALTGGTTSIGLLTNGTIQSDVTTEARMFSSSTSTAAASFTLNNLVHYYVFQGGLGAGSSISSQSGFFVNASMVGATNNYGFRGSLAAATGRWNAYMDGTADNYFAGNVGVGITTPTAKLNIVDSGTQDAVRITQTGTGNALVVEDSASTDASPFVVDRNGNVGIGEASPSSYVTNGAVLKASAGFTPSIISWNQSADASSSLFASRKDRSGAIVQSGDELYRFVFGGYDGASYINAGSISAFVDGTPGLNDMPGRIVFSTTADGASSPTERMRITNAGNVGIGVTAPTAKLDVQSTTSGVRFPNMTTAQKNAISGPQAGTIVFDTTLSKLSVYSGTAWETVTSV